MTKKVDRALHGPSWTEVILGAFLSLILGAVIGAVLLVLRPVAVVRDEPKERERNTVYYFEGSRDTGKARQAPVKRNAFLAGQSVTLTEEEINALIATQSAAAAAEKKAAPKGKDGKEAAGAGVGDYVTTDAPTVRIREGVFQVGAPVTIGLVDQKIIAHARGGFEKEGAYFVFKPTEMYLGSCPVQKLPFLPAYVRNKFIEAQPVPEDLKTAWGKLTNVAVEGNTLKLTMP